MGGTGQGQSSGKQKTPKLVITRPDISDITCGDAHVLVLLKDNSLLVWGANGEASSEPELTRKVLKPQQM
jgi:alpha-tubulin suppressor-like RCC1 family protein